MIPILGVSHKDAAQAARWLDYVGRMDAGMFLVVMLSQAVSAADERAIQVASRRLAPSAVRCPDMREDGYPLSASHLFLRSLEHCENHHAGQPILWLEPDTLPMHKGWVAAIAEEYAACGKPFMGHIERGHGAAHMAGCGVYPAEWREKAPKLASVLEAPDIFWGKGLGQAFDTWASDEIVPQAAEARTIQQIWRPALPVTLAWLRANVRPDVALFHQVKDASGFKTMRRGA